MKKVLKLMVRLAWMILFGLFIAFHNMYEKEFKSMDDDSRIEIKDEDDRG